MAERLRTLARDIVTYGSASLVGRSAALISLPILTRFLDPAQFGAWTFLAALLGLLGAVLPAGTDGALLRFHFGERRPEGRERLAATFLGFVVVAGLVGATLLVPWSSSIARWGMEAGSAGLVVIALAGLPASLAATACGQVLRARFAGRRVARLDALTSTVSATAAVGAVAGLGLGVAGLVASYALTAWLVMPLYLASIRGLVTRPGPAAARADLVRLLRFGLPLAPATVSFWVMASADRFVLARLAGLAEVGVYGVAGSVAGAIHLAHAAVAQAWSPRAIELWETDRKTARRYYEHLLELGLAVFGSLAVGLSLLAPEILRVFAPPSFQAAATVIAPLCLANVALASTQITSLGITVANRTGAFPVLAGAAALANVLLNVLLVPRWGVVAAALATLASYVGLSLGYAICSRAWSGLRWSPWRPMCIAAITAIVTLAPGIATWLGQPVGTAVRLVAAAAYLPLLWTLGLFRPAGLPGLLEGDGASPGA